MINSALIKEFFCIDVPEFTVTGLGTTDAGHSTSILSFLSDKKYISELNGNENIKVVFVIDEISSLVRHDIQKIIVDEPKWYFFKLLDYIARNKIREKTYISNTASIHPSSVVSEKGVVIGDNVKIEPNVTIYSDVVIEYGVVVRAGAVIGVDGYEHKRTSKGIVSVAHDGRVILKKNSEIGVNSNIVKGFSYRDTIVGEETKIDALVHYAHGVQCGSRCMIVASAMIAGHVTIGDDVWIGPNASISNRISIGDNAFVTLGSVVVRDVSVGEKVTGNFAIPHTKFIRNLRASVK